MSEKSELLGILKARYIYNLRKAASDGNVDEALFTVNLIKKTFSEELRDSHIKTTEYIIVNLEDCKRLGTTIYNWTKNEIIGFCDDLFELWQWEIIKDGKESVEVGDIQNVSLIANILQEYLPKMESIEEHHKEITRLCQEIIEKINKNKHHLSEDLPVVFTYAKASVCNQCNGSGTCRTCQGTRLCSVCDGTGGCISHRNLHCGGTGKCVKCGGTGKCPACLGRGVIYE